MERPQLITCPPSQRAAALRKLNAACRPDQQDVLALAIQSMDRADESAWDGLLLSGENDALWVQPTAGNTAIVWLPPPDCPATADLLRAAAEFVDDRNFSLAQIILAGDEGYSPQLLERGGFPHLADLLYLVADARPTPATNANQSKLTFVPRAGEDPDRLAAILEQTYEQTLDCRGLDGVRSMADVLVGYRAQGTYLPEHWYFVQRDAQDVGALLMSAHPPAGNWELVYMGVVPAERGRALGESIVDIALVVAHRAGAQQVVLAVDAANEPAIAMYRRVGFIEWNRRRIYARTAPHGKTGL